MQQQQRQIGNWLAERGYAIKDHGDECYSLLQDGREYEGKAPEDVAGQYDRWVLLEDQRWKHRRGATAAEIELLDRRIVDKGFQRLDEEQLEALQEGGGQADALLSDLQVRIGVFTDDFSAMLSGEDPALAFDGGEHLKYGLLSESLPLSLAGDALPGEQEEAGARRLRP